jgi:hypothetical protein
MKNFLIILEGTGTFNSNPLKTIRLTEKSEDYANGVVFGLKVGYPNNSVFIEEIKKLKE